MKVGRGRNWAKGVQCLSSLNTVADATRTVDVHSVRTTKPCGTSFTLESPLFNTAEGKKPRHLGKVMHNSL